VAEGGGLLNQSHDDRPFSNRALNLRVQAENVPIPILSRRVPISRFPTRSLHNLLHTRSGGTRLWVRNGPDGRGWADYSRA
jgi:hypothetical protein